MLNRKFANKYYFSVEGETEQWYLQWLQNEINAKEEAIYKVSFDCKVEKNPLKRAKSMTLTDKTDIWHLSDYESDAPFHTKQFTDVMDNMAKVREMRKQITYYFGYSNFTFDLWVILHKSNCNGHLSNRKDYLSTLNRAYAENFENMDEYKHENNFKRCLSKLSLNDVIVAIERAKEIMENNAGSNGYVEQQYRGYKYYKENPSLLVWVIIEKILKDCVLIQ